MNDPARDTRSAERRIRDEQIASEPFLSPPDLLSKTMPTPVETHFALRNRPLAVAGIVEDGLVRPLDPGVSLAQHSRVIIVTSQI